MSCIFRIGGGDPEIHDFLSQSGIKPYKTFYKGEPRSKQQQTNKTHEYSGCSIEVSKAGFDEFNDQVNDVIRYLELNYDNLKLIQSFPEIQFATLDFSMNYHVDKFVQSKYFPITLLKLCADLDIGIELSIYQSTEHEV